MSKPHIELKASDVRGLALTIRPSEGIAFDLDGYKFYVIISKLKGHSVRVVVVGGDRDRLKVDRLEVINEKEAKPLDRKPLIRKVGKI